MYKKIKKLLFKFNPESVHDSIVLLGRLMSFTRVSRTLRPFFVYKSKILEEEILGIKFQNPIGLAAGFDKNGYLTNFIPDLGFGFIEIGSLTAKQCEGNPKPRLHRIIKNRGIIVNYGLVNQGVEKVYKRIKGKKFRIPVGISIAKTNDSSIKGNSSVDDYFEGLKKMKGVGSYTTINISCQNVGDGRSFEDPILLEKLLMKIKGWKNIFLKISPDLKKEKLDKLLSLGKKYSIAGFIISNLIKERKGLSEDENLKFKGGISGKPVNKKSDEMLKYVYKKTNGKFILIGCGGVFDGKDAYRKIKNGASLIQMVTGLIFEGPSVVKKINQELVRLLREDGYKNIKEAIGKNIN